MWTEDFFEINFGSKSVSSPCGQGLRGTVLICKRLLPGFTTDSGEEVGCEGRGGEGAHRMCPINKVIS